MNTPPWSIKEISTPNKYPAVKVTLWEQQCNISFFVYTTPISSTIHADLIAL